jgi:hypothetical protein
MRKAVTVFLFLIMFGVPGAAFADDADPVLVQRWMCTFFKTASYERPNLLASAPLPFEPNSALSHEQEQGSSGRSRIDTWSVGRFAADWRAVYKYQTRLDRPMKPEYGFSLRVEGDRTVMLPDEESVLVFLKGFEPPEFDPELEKYTTGVRDPSVPEDDPLAYEFEIEFSLRSQDLRLSWRQDSFARHGLRFCSP